MRISDWSSDVCSSDRILGALFNGLFLVGMAIYVLWMGAMRLMEPIDLATTPMLLAAAGGIATELVALWLLYNRPKGNLKMQGAFWQIVQTFVGSFIILVSALVIRFTSSEERRGGKECVDNCITRGLQDHK